MNLSNIQEYNESLLIGECNVFHAGLNRNGSDISKVCAENMTSKMAYIPVVGEWKEAQQDFGDHGGKLEISSEGVKFIDTTAVMGCVLNEPVFKKEVDGQEYYCCRVALYKEKFPQLEAFVNERKGQSMEINVNKGRFDENDGIYYIDDATMTSLCILGNDVEPCFASSKISTFSLNEFEKQYQEVLSKVKEAFTLDGKEDTMEQNKEKQFEQEDIEKGENFTEGQEVVDKGENAEKTPIEQGADDKELHAKKKEDEEGKEEEPKDEEGAPSDEEEEDESKKKKKCTLTDEEIFALIDKCERLETENSELKAFKATIDEAERKEKVDNLFAKFAKLTEEETKDLKAKAYSGEITCEEAEVKMYELIGRKALLSEGSFTAEEKSESKATVSVGQDSDSETETTSPYGGLTKYFK